jgi:hypothetical protein
MGKAHSEKGEYKSPKKAPPSVLKEKSPKQALKDTQVSVGNNRTADYDGVKTSGIKIRGTGAATKGLMARGPMA